jgi:hypothetical protein
MHFTKSLLFAVGLACWIPSPWAAAIAAEDTPATQRVKALGGKIEFDPATGEAVEVDLLEKQATDADVPLLATLKGLKKLTLWGAEISDKGVKHLAEFPKLTTLILENTEVTDAGLAVLEKMPQLKSLNLRRSTYMTDAGLAHAKNLKNLQ